jgi:hypothetical protein
VKLDIVIDVSTGESWYEGPLGQQFSHEEVEAATLDVTPRPAGRSTQELLRQLMDDCPDCQAALARGEQPVVHDGEELQRLLATYSPRHRGRR